jgi:hypothetical protein
VGKLEEEEHVQAARVRRDVGVELGGAADLPERTEPAEELRRLLRRSPSLDGVHAGASGSVDLTILRHA